MDELTQARRLLDAIGPGRMLLVGPEKDRLAIELRRLGCEVALARAPAVLAGTYANDDEDARFDALLWSSDVGVSMPSSQTVAALTRRERGVLALLREPGRAAPPAPSIRRAALNGGWRRSLRDWSLQHYRELDQAHAWSELYFEPMPRESAAATLPAGVADPTLECTAPADALLARHALAAELARPGDHVLLVGCGSGAGAALVVQRSRCARVTAIDTREGCIAYARRHFAAGGRVSFDVADPRRLEKIAARSVDLVVAFDVSDDTSEAEAAAAEFARVLKPDGRIVASAFADAGHALEALLGERFLIEARHHQPVPEERGAPRSIDRLAPADEPPAGGWRLVVAAANPLGADRAGFELPEFARSGAPRVPVTDFGAHYDNPWLYRPMVQMGQRLQDGALLTDLALQAFEQADGASADAGAALCVLAYQVLGQRRADQVENLLPLIDVYADKPAANPHVLRWQLSLEFAGALACLTSGALPRAEAYFERVLRRDPLAFSPLLATKLVAAAFWLGIRRLVKREPERARACFAAGVDAAARALQAPIEQSIGSRTQPNTFGFQELAEVADMASQCAQALDALEHFDAAPGRFWRQVDARRFGLATWLQHLERENRELREQLQRAGAC